MLVWPSQASNSGYVFLFGAISDEAAVTRQQNLLLDKVSINNAVEHDEKQAVTTISMGLSKQMVNSTVKQKQGHHQKP